MGAKGTTKPVVLILAGHDPSGGAGIQADIETVASIGSAAASIITSLTAQNTRTFSRHVPQLEKDFLEQAQLVFEDMQISACKIGATGHPLLIRAINDLLRDRKFPIVLDPVLQSTTGHDFADTEMYKATKTLLVPIATVITPNLGEARQLTDETVPARAAKVLLEQGCRSVLITDAEKTGSEIINHLYTNDGTCNTYTWKRLPENYHGSGCTLSSAIAALLAQGVDILTSVERAQQYTWNTLRHGIKFGEGQMHPDRFFWQKGNRKLFEP